MKLPEKAITAAADLAAGAAIAAKRNRGGYTAAVIVAAGNSTRMGGKVSKQFSKVAGVPVLCRTLSAFRDSGVIDEIVIVAREEDRAAVCELAGKSGLSGALPFSVVTGGKTRALSVQNGFAAVSPKAKYVAIHDGARCLITPEEIRKVCRAAVRYRAATAAHPVTDSVKLANSRGFIEKSVDRKKVWLVQTPQVFLADLYRAALATAGDTATVTDDNALMEQIRYPVKLVECNRDNIKITTPDDIFRAEEILRKRGEHV